jgi:hypothetical protein
LELAGSRMATERLVRTAVDITGGLLQKDIGQVVKSIMDLVLTVRNNKQKCQELANHVQSAADAVCCVEKDREEKGSSSLAFSDDKYKTSLQQFLIVVKDCEEYVRRYSTKGSVARVWSSLMFEEGFVSLNTRLENARKWFDFALQVNNTATLDDLKDQMTSFISELKALQEGRMDPDDLQLSNVTVGESLVEGYILAGLLDDQTDVILVATEQQKKEASILKRLSDKDNNILRFYGTFSHGSSQKYLIFERPRQTLQTLYDWKMEEAHKNEWRLKRTMALEIAFGLDSAHIAGIVHKNLRSSNIFLTDDGHPKIFGFFKGRVSSQISDKKWTDGDQLRWAAPEMLTKDRPQYNEKCDIFSLGVIMWELITDDFPFFELHGTKGLVNGRVKNKTKLNFQRSELDHVPFLVDFKQVSLDCMNDTPGQRPTMNDVIRRLMGLAPEEMCGSLGGGPA